MLLQKTLKGNVDQVGFVHITGTVVNRRGKTLKYAQITFTIYDASGAQVGHRNSEHQQSGSRRPLEFRGDLGEGGEAVQVR